MADGQRCAADRLSCFLSLVSGGKLRQMHRDRVRLLDHLDVDLPHSRIGQKRFYQSV